MPEFVSQSVSKMQERVNEANKLLGQIVSITGNYHVKAMSVPFEFNIVEMLYVELDWPDGRHSRIHKRQWMERYKQRYPDAVITHNPPMYSGGKPYLQIMGKLNSGAQYLIHIQLDPNDLPPKSEADGDDAEALNT